MEERSWRFRTSRSRESGTWRRHRWKEETIKVGEDTKIYVRRTTFEGVNKEVEPGEGTLGLITSVMV